MTGSLQEKGGKYYAVLNMKEQNGKRKQKWISTKLPIKGNKKRAEKILRDLLKEYEDNPCPAVKEKVYLSEFLQSWLDVTKPDLQTTTYDGYVHILSKHIKPYFADKKSLLHELKAHDLSLYYSEKVASGLNPNTVLKHHGIIRTALQYAVDSSLIQTNIADAAKKPKRRKFTASYYNSEELNALFQATSGTVIEIVVLLTAYYGLRRSEVLGLKWDNIDFRNQSISIFHKVVRTFNENGKLAFSAEDEMKTTSSRRTFPLNDDLIERLQEQKNNQLENMRVAGKEYSVDYQDYVCVDALGCLLKPDFISHKFRKILESHNLRKIRFHDLRHSCATLLLHLGFDMKAIQEWLGHATMQTTANLYTHVDFSKKSEMLQTVSSQLILG